MNVIQIWFSSLRVFLNIPIISRKLTLCVTFFLSPERLSFKILCIHLRAKVKGVSNDKENKWNWYLWLKIFLCWLCNISNCKKIFCIFSEILCFRNAANLSCTFCDSLDFYRFEILFINSLTLTPIILKRIVHNSMTRARTHTLKKFSIK